MKIIHLGNVPVPAEFATAKSARQHLGRWALNHAIAQKNAGMDAEIVSIAHKAERDFTCEIDGVKCRFLRTFHPYRHFTFYAIDQMRLARTVRRLGADIVHAHGTEGPYALGAIRSGLPFCVTAQGLFFQIIPALGGKPDMNQRFIRASENWALKRTKFAVAKSEYVRDALAAEYPHLDLTLIPNTYAPDLDYELVEKTGKRMVFIGSINKRKGFHTITEAMPRITASHPSVELHVLGNPPEGSGSEFAIKNISNLRSVLGDRLILHGKQPAAYVFKILDECRLLLAPSLEEMFGNQLIEGLMRGCSAIVSEGTALAENARRFGGPAIVPQDDSGALAAEACRILSNPLQLSESEIIRDNIRKYMSPSGVAATHGSLYEKVMTECGKRIATQSE